MVKTKHVIVTGGGSGVGANIARTFHNAGAKVTIFGRDESALKRQSLPYQVCDVTDASAVKKVFGLAREQQGPVDIVIANAGNALSKPFAQMSHEDLNAMLAVNLVGVFNTWQNGLTDMVERDWGRLIVVASTAGLKGYPYVSGYCAAKHGVIGMMKALSLELAKTGITVNAICPGFTETPLLARSIENIVAATKMSDVNAAKILKNNNPQQRFIQTDEISSAAMWLCDETSRSVTGHSLSISGGEI